MRVDLLPVPIDGWRELREEGWHHLNNFTGNYHLTLVAPRYRRDKDLSTLFVECAALLYGGEYKIQREDSSATPIKTR